MQKITYEAFLALFVDAINQERHNRKLELLPIRTEYPETCALMDELQQDLPIPPRHEETPRICKDPGLPPTITIRTK